MPVRMPGTDNVVFRVNQSGPPTAIADLSQFQQANPVAQPNAGDFVGICSSGICTPEAYSFTEVRLKAQKSRDWLSPQSAVWLIQAY